MEGVDHPWRFFLATARHGTYSCGWGRWQGKPRLGLVYCWYDGPHYCLHIGPLWIEVDAD